MTPADEKLAQEYSSERQSARERVQILFICDREECSSWGGELKPVEKKSGRGRGMAGPREEMKQ